MPPTAAQKPEVLLESSQLATDVIARKRLILGVDGLDKQGKTHFALTAPKPLVFLDFDIGSEGVKERPEFKALGHKILMPEPFMFRPTESVFLSGKTEKDSDEIIQKAAEPVLERFRRTYLKALKEPVLKHNGKLYHARTVIVDTGSEAWELLRLVEFGKLSQVKSHHYTKVNGLMRDIVRAGYDSNVNVIWLHKMKKEWKEGADGKNKTTGTLERSGFGEMSYLMQANCLCYRAPRQDANPITWKWKSGDGLVEFTAEPRIDESDQGWRFRVGNSRHNPLVEGTELMNDQITFDLLAQMVIEDSSPEDWADSF